MPLPAALRRAKIPAAVREVLVRLGAAGHRSWIVGGAVRDLLLHRPREANDFDVATPATPEEVGALFRKVVPTGIDHGTVTVVIHGEGIEVTTFRGEGAYADGRRPDSVTFHTDLEADLARRDFTMNAIAWDPLAGELRDPFHGREDMKDEVVRAVGDPSERFGEDGLRPLRAVRFAAQLGYALHPRTRSAIRGALHVVRKVSVERIADELSRLVVAPHAPEALAIARSTGLLEVVLPALAALPGGTLAHAAEVLRGAPPGAEARFAALLHPVGPEEAERILVGLRLPRRLSGEVAALLRGHACRRGRDARLPGDAAAVRRWLSRVGPERAPALLGLASAEAGTLPADRRKPALGEVRRLERAVRDVLGAGSPLRTEDLPLDGRAVMRVLGAGPGPHVGEALRHLLDRVLEDPSLDAAALERELGAWWARRG